MTENQIITLTTDFGYRDPFAGVVRGVILSINPHAIIIDLTHGIRPHDISEAAFVMGINYRYFPKGSIHMAVVDPGVGSKRRPIIVSVDGHYFIGPDNGIFSYLFHMNHEVFTVVHITAGHYFLSSHSPTFQGRDVFAPVAAWFSKGVDISKFGEPITDYEKIPLALPAMTPEGAIQGEVMLIDGFGNAITNITKADIDKVLALSPEGHIKPVIKGIGAAFKQYYSEAETGKFCVLINSSGYLEFFINRGNAAVEYGISPGEKVKVIFTAN
jgi:S-adenosylmethionine hydrolase